MSHTAILFLNILDEEVQLEFTFTIAPAEPDVGIPRAGVGDWFLSSTIEGTKSAQFYQAEINRSKAYTDLVYDSLNEAIDQENYS